MVAHDYWDACMFLEMLKDDDPAKVAAASAGIKEAEAGRLVIVTSTLSLAETLYLVRGELPVSQATRDKIRAFFRNEFILLREVDRVIAERSQDLIWDHGVCHKDAIHLATALSVRDRLALGQLATFDGPLSELSGRIDGLRIGTPSYPVDLISDAAIHQTATGAARGGSQAGPSIV